MTSHIDHIGHIYHSSILAGMVASMEPSGGYLNRQPKVAGVASCTLINVTNARVPLEALVI